MKKDAQATILIKELKLLPETRDFFDTQNSRAIPVFIGSIFFLFAGVILWSSLAKMDDVVKAQAVLRPVDTISSIKSLKSGEVIGIHYRQNDTIKKGALLLQIDTSAERVELKNNQNLIQITQTEINETESLLRVIHSVSLADATPSNTKEAAFLAEYDSRKSDLAQFEKDYQRELNMPETMKVRQKIDDSAVKAQQSKMLLESWTSNQALQAKNNLETLKGNKHSLEVRNAVLERSIKDSQLYAPISGRVDSIQQLNIGDYVIAGNELLRIIPEDKENLKTEIIVDAAHIARIKTGQQVKLRFPGLPPSSFGQLSTVVSEIPADMTIVSNLPVFPVAADIPNPYLVSSTGEKIYSRSGISAQARIIISTDTVLNMVLRKLDFIN